MHTEIEINASPIEVRRLLLDFSSLPSYHTSFLTIKPIPTTATTTAASRHPQIGDRLNVTANGIPFTPVVTVNSVIEFAWLGSLPYIFSGCHRFRFLPSDKTAGTTRFEHSEDFTGLLAPAFRWFGQGATEVGFRRFNEDLKRRVESQI